MLGWSFFTAQLRLASQVRLGYLRSRFEAARDYRDDPMPASPSADPCGNREQSHAMEGARNSVERTRPFAAKTRRSRTYLAIRH